MQAGIYKVNNQKACMSTFKLFLAERAGFEPALGYYPKHAFQACDLNRSSTSPKVAQDKPERALSQSKVVLEIIFPGA